MEASGAIDPMEGICLFLWSDAPATTKPLTRTRARAVHIPIDRSVYAAAGKWTGEGPSLGSETLDGGEKRKLARACGSDQHLLSGAAGNRTRRIKWLELRKYWI
jgi:hypothetical protein